MGIIFEFDPAKAASNRRKHGVDFPTATEIFQDALSLTIADVAHSCGEERFITIGQTQQGELLVVVHVDKGEGIRLISARRATVNERKCYEDT